MKYCTVFIFILLWFITFVNCDNVCGDHEGEKKCCTHYQFVNRTCVECPKGWFGNECNLPCPNGYYGVLCTRTCNCTDDQICDVQDGCVQNKAVECQKGFFGEECKLSCPDGWHGVYCKERCNCTTDQICDVQDGCVQNNTDNTLIIMETTSTEQETTKPNGYHEGIPWNHLYGVTLGAVLIILVILLVHTHRKWKTIDQESEYRHDQQTGEAISQAVELNKNTEETVYDEICEFDTGCSHNHKLSSDSISFSNLKEKKRTKFNR